MRRQHVQTVATFITCIHAYLNFDTPFVTVHNRFALEYVNRKEDP